MRIRYNSVAAGVLIGIGGTVYLCTGGIVGAVLFSVALASILYLDMWLYTGKICYTCNPLQLVTGCIGNVLGCILCAAVVYCCNFDITDQARELIAGKMMQPWYQALSRGIMCEVLIYIAVKVWRDHKSMLGVLLCIPTFILSGYEHSIADVFYYALAARCSWQLLWVIIGNTVAGLGIMRFARLREAHDGNG